MEKENLFYLPVLPLKEEFCSELIHSKEVRIERIVSTGQTSDWYDQEEAEYVILVQGAAKICYEDGREETLQAGDMCFLLAHKKHKVCYTSTEPPCIWICIFWKVKENG